MKQIDSRFPVFAQLEVGDTIYTIDVSDKLIMAHRIVSVTDTNIDYNSDVTRGRFTCYTKDMMLSSSFIDDRGIGWATSREAAVEGIHNSLDTKINMVEKTITSHEVEIDKLRCKKEALMKLKKQF